MEEKILINKYRIIKELGRGGMAIVYLAEDKQLKREVAVKMLHPHMNQGEHIVRFEREAIVLATLSHPNIVNIFEFFEFEGNFFIVYEFVDGETLGKFLENNIIKYPIISLMISYEIIEAIEYIHKNEIIHRDIKPENIMISKDGSVKVMDFGIAKVLSNVTVTDAGALLGSPAYMSPEQVMGEEITYKSDIFSIGVLIYKLITNRSPFASTSTASTLKNVLNSSYSNISHPLVDKGMMRIIEYCLYKEPKKRIKDLESLKSIIKIKIETEGKKAPYKKELALFFNNPENYQKKLKKELLEHYKKYSYKLYKEKNILKSLNYCSKALELGPKDPQLKILSNKLKIFNNGKRLKIIISFFVVLTIILLIFLNLIFIKQNKISYKYKLSALDYSYLKLVSKSKFLDNLMISNNLYTKQIIKNYKKAPIKKKKGHRKETHDRVSQPTMVTDKKPDRKDHRKEIHSRVSQPTMVTDKKPDRKDHRKEIHSRVSQPTMVHPKEKIKYGKLSYCFRPYAKVYINNKPYPNSCISNGIKLPYGKYSVIAKYPYSDNYKSNITINDNHKNLSLRYNFNSNSKVYLNLKSISPIIISVKNEYGKYVIVKTKKGKEILFKNLNLGKIKLFFIKPGRYYMDITNGDIYYNNLLLNITQKRNYTVNMDLENDKNIKIQ